MHDRLSSPDWLQTHTFEVCILEVYICLRETDCLSLGQQENEAKAEMPKSQLKSWISLWKFKLLVPKDIMMHRD